MKTARTSVCGHAVGRGHFVESGVRGKTGSGELLMTCCLVYLAWGHH